MKLTKKKFLKFAPCPEGLAYAESKGYDFHRMWAECEDSAFLLWGLNKLDLLTPVLSARLGAEFAEHVLPIWEARHPGDARPRKAIEAARKFASNPTDENWHAARDASNAARDASYAVGYAMDAVGYTLVASATDRKWQADKIREIVGKIEL